MRLFATPLSHFSRKVRLLLDFYDISYELIDVGNVAQAEQIHFGNNPLMSVPVLSTDGLWLIQSDHIASYIVRKFDEADKLEVLTNNLIDLNIRAILNGIMENEVKIILAQRSHIPIENYDYYKKCFKAINQGLKWIEENSHHFSASKFKYRELHLICTIDHLKHYNLVPLESFEKTREVVNMVSKNPFVFKSAFKSSIPSTN
jgi:glutathione S-transferase